MSFAVRPMFASGHSWSLVGVGAVSTTSTVNFPATAQAGDLAVFCGSVTYTVTAGPSGFSAIAAGSTAQFYKVCAGGESSVSWSGLFAMRAAILLFRPSGGVAALYDGKTDSPAVNRTMTASSKPSLIVAIGNVFEPESWSPTLPGTWNGAVNEGAAPGLYAAWRTLDPSESTGTMNLGGSGRQTFGIWGLS